MSYTAPAGNIIDLPIGGGVSYTPAAGNLVALPIEDIHPAPVAIADAYSIAQNVSRTLVAPGVLSNDVLYSGAITANTSPAHGSLTFNSDGSFTYTPATSYVGSDSFTYTLGNDNGFATATVTLTVYAAPTAVGHLYYVVTSGSLSVSAPGVLNGATLNGATIVSNSTPSHGSVTVNPDGSFVYSPTTGYAGTDSFTFTISNYAGSSTATISLVVMAPPHAIDDSYATQQNVALTVGAPGPLYNDDLEGATVAAGASPAHGTLTFNSDGSFVYTPTFGYNGSDSFTYVLTNAVGTSTGTVNITVQAIPATIRYTQRGWSAPWTMDAQLPVEIAVVWTAPGRKRAELSGVFTAAPRRSAEVAGVWTTIPRKTAEIISPWSMPARAAAEVAAVWAAQPRKAAEIRAEWTDQPRRATERAIAWLCPPRIAVGVSAPFTVQPRLDHEVAIAWLNPPRVLRRWWFPWGIARRVAWQPPGSPGISVPPTSPYTPYMPPPGAQVDLTMECFWFDLPAGQLELPIGPYACYASTIKRKTYMLQNTASVVRLPERTPISVSSIKIGATRDNPLRSLAMILAQPTDVDYLKADSDGPKIVEVNVNGYVWTALINYWDDDRQWVGPSAGIAGGSGTGTGRRATVAGVSQPALLDAPWALPKSLVQASDFNAQQLIDNELEFSGFTQTYTAVDWLVNGGVWSYDRITPLAAINTVAAASGAIVLSHRYDKTLLIIPRYPDSPWNWTSATIDKTITDDIILDITGKVESKPLYDYVLVSGQQVGVSDPIQRTGSAGTTRATMVVDPLITTHPVSAERGRNVLADRGVQQAGDIVIPLFPTSETAQPGLIEVQDLLHIVEPTPWHAICTDVLIEADQVQDSGGHWVLVVKQTISYERHLSDAD